MHTQVARQLCFQSLFVCSIHLHLGRFVHDVDVMDICRVLVFHNTHSGLGYRLGWQDRPVIFGLIEVVQTVIGLPIRYDDVGATWLEHPEESALEETPRRRPLVSPRDF